MTSSHNQIKRRRIKGAATLIVSTILLVVSTLIIIFAANYGMMQGKATGNTLRFNQAYQAAEAGLEFGINYLKHNSATILANPVGGFVPAYSDANITNAALPDGSRYTIVYSNPVASNYTLIRITSTGTSSDGSSSHTISQLVQASSALVNFGTTALLSKGSVNLSGNADIDNFSHNSSITAGSGVTMSGNADTTTSTSHSYPGHYESDISQNNTTVANMSLSAFIATYFGVGSAGNLQSMVQNYYSNTANTNYSSTLNGRSGTTIMINQAAGTTASITGNTVIGTSTNPVLLIVNGQLSISGNVRVYGFIFVMGTSGLTSTTGNMEINGAIVSANNLTMSGNSSVNFNTSILNNLRNNASLNYYAKIPGSWKDF